MVFAAAGAAGATGRENGAFKALYLVKRRSDFTYEAFAEYQVKTHVPLALQLPGLQRYELDLFRPAADGAEQPFDAVATVWFADRAAHDAALASEAGERARADLPKFLDTDSMVVLFGEAALAETLSG